MTPRFSIVIPVYNRPEEINELLASLVLQTFKDFEVIIVEDGSSVRCDEVVDTYRAELSIQYFFKQNSGPGPSRNFGFLQARGDFFVVFDSDCIIPPHYLSAVDNSISKNAWDAWGGPDQAHESFNTIQRAMGYTMSSTLTTGGIRGNEKRIGDFQPRSFNMGLSRNAFERTGGFKLTHFAEDIELSISMKLAGLKVGLIASAFVYHKRRTSFRQFFRQVFNFGKGRVMIGRVHPGFVKITHWLPAIFLLCVCFLPLTLLISIRLFILGFTVLGIYWMAILFDALSQSGSWKVAVLAIPSAIIQLCGYGLGFLTEFLREGNRKG